MIHTVGKIKQKSNEDGRKMLRQSIDQVINLMWPNTTGARSQANSGKTLYLYIQPTFCIYVALICDIDFVNIRVESLTVKIHGTCG